MEDQEFIFNGKRFKYLQDFEQEFKPTKWSIRKYMTFIKVFLPHESFKFEEHTIKMLESYAKADKDTLNFIKQIYVKQAKRAKLFNEDMYGTDGVHLSESKDNYDKIIKMLVVLQKDGIIQGTLKNIADILTFQFSVSYSKSTIMCKMYQFSEELNEETFKKETFKNFHAFIDNI